MRKEFLPFSRPSITQAEIEAVAALLRSGWIAQGPRVEEFERAFAEYCGARSAAAVSSGTAGLHLALAAAGIGPGDEVITASLSWPAAANMVHLLGAAPVFADVDRDTLQLDPASVEERITTRTRAVIPVHFAGGAADLGAFRALCRRRGLHLIEDAAHAAGAAYGEERIGSGENPAVFSFHAIKNLTTGEGGMITVGDEDLAARLRLLRLHGVDRDAWKRYGKGGAGGYELEEPGWKYALTDIQAALGIEQLRRLDAMNARRAELAARYDDLLDRVPEVLRPDIGRSGRPSHHLYPVLIDRERTGCGRDEFREELRRRNIGTGFHFPAVHRLAFYRERHPAPAGRLHDTEWAADRILSLPLFPDMTDADVDDVVAAIKETLSRRK